MNYLDLPIIEIHKALIEEKVTPFDLVSDAIKRAKEDDNNAFEYICEKEAFEFVEHLNEKDKNNVMWGIPFIIKDNFSTKDIPTTASSNLLSNYKPVFSSEVYSRLVNAGGIPIGKTTMDEFAMGGSGTTGHLGPTYNPYDKSKKHIVGGSSCGSAAGVANSIVPLGIGSDTGDSVRKPAVYSGLVGFKPTWGRISRYGLFPFAPSLDHVAYFTRSVEDTAALLEILAGRDLKDSTSSELPIENYFQNLNPDIKDLKVAVIDEFLDAVENEEIKKLFLENLQKIEKKGAKVSHISFDINLCKAIFPTYFVISCAEAISSNAYLDGIKFGLHFDGEDYLDIIKKTRTKGFSNLIKRRFIVGAYSLLKENQDETFLRAQKCRRILVDSINYILKEYDVVYLPSTSNVAPLFSQINNKIYSPTSITDDFLALGNLAGLPSITLPIGFSNNLPFGVSVTSAPFKEQKVLNFALAIQNITGLKNLSAKELEK